MKDLKQLLGDPGTVFMLLSIALVGGSVFIGVLRMLSVIPQ